MYIAGLQKTTLVDFPGKVAATVFTRGCSFRCPFCHNPELVLPEKFIPLLPMDDFFEFLESRQGKLQGICITGGEPLLHKDANQFIARIKQLGFAIKVDTNGSFPDRLEEIIKEGNVDYIAMDIKAPLKKYAEVAMPNFVSSQKPTSNLESENLKKQYDLKIKQSLEDIKKSIKLIMDSGLDYEFRTTVCHPLHQPEDFQEIGELIAGAKKYYIQNFVHSKHNDETVNFLPFTIEELNQAQKYAQKYINQVSIR